MIKKGSVNCVEKDRGDTAEHKGAEKLRPGVETVRLVIVVLVLVLYWLRICLYNAHFRASLADLRRSKRSNFLVHSGMLMLLVLCRLLTCKGQVRVFAVLREDGWKNLHRDYVSQRAHRIQEQ